MRLLSTAIIGLAYALGRAHEKPIRRPEHSKGLVRFSEHQVDHVDHHRGNHKKTRLRRLQTGTATMKATQLGDYGNPTILDVLQFGLMFGPSPKNGMKYLNRGVMKPNHKRFLSLRGSSLGWFSPEAFIRSVHRM
ncbi:MAG: uncharacterized protein KVP18_000895 [Porospora cf. gigantea A]|uniref:uncharacterized protein n=1 Tax=Porospora cf. gigantea A TaxID=2853593 RepID=UPI003559A819|nr:MAG: hypothetical protein KVP18_000895 [Porospora cf. gigantea A]